MLFRSDARFEAHRAIPIVAMTAYAMPADRGKCLHAGMDDHIAKPVDMHALESVIERVMRRERAQRDGQR